jgi:hypothetical protein
MQASATALGREESKLEAVKVELQVIPSVHPETREAGITLSVGAIHIQAAGGEAERMAVAIIQAVQLAKSWERVDQDFRAAGMNETIASERAHDAVCDCEQRGPAVFQVWADHGKEV